MTRRDRIRLSEAARTFLERQRDMGRADETLRVYAGLLRRLERDLGDLQMESITRKHAEAWIYGLRREHVTDQWGRKTNPGITPGTFNQTLSTLRVFFKFCMTEGWIRQNPVGQISMMRIPQKPRQRPSVPQLLSMLEVPKDPRDRAYLAVALNTALRQSEIQRILIGDINLDAGFMSVIIKKTGDVDEQPITADLDRELRRWMVAYEENIGRPLQPSDYLIPGKERVQILRNEKGRITTSPTKYVGERPCNRMEKVVKGALEAVGLPTNQEGTHTIRRAVARAYFDQVSADQGDVAALRETAALLHHSNLQTTERYLGMTAEKNRRNQRMQGQAFLTGMVQTENVVTLKSVKGE